MNKIKNTRESKLRRFKSDKNTLVKFNFYNKENEIEEELDTTDFDFIGIAYNESFYGVGAIFVCEDKISIGQQCILKLGKLNTLLAEIKWLKQIENGIFKIGFELLN